MTRVQIDWIYCGFEEATVDPSLRSGSQNAAEASGHCFIVRQRTAQKRATPSRTA